MTGRASSGYNLSHIGVQDKAEICSFNSIVKNWLEIILKGGLYSTEDETKHWEV